VDPSIELSEEDLLIDMTQQPGYVTDGDNDVTVVLDTNLSDELIDEGFANELVSKIQNMRKDAGFEVTDHIILGYEGNDRIAGIFESHGERIARDVLADKLVTRADGGFVKDQKINGEAVKMSVTKI
ncbi:MAG: isoleucine--tRNA ligase, partial [Lachnospiraceae bacterium]|nr:isoleucine--tRNA ligase [Lachnospiraceae bacterium]